MDDDIFFLSATELTEHYARGALSPVEVVDALWDRLERLDAHLNAYVRRDIEDARAEAVRAEAAYRSGGPRRPLAGVPLAVKDVFGSGPTTASSRLLADYVAPVESTATARLRDSGGVVMGKTATYEFAFGRPSRESLHPPARNPWDRDREPGGSSSGTAVAVAAGLAHSGIGTDTTGSVRWPAAHCGVVGLKPTYGRVPRTGVVPLSWSLDHVGPITRSVADAALICEVMAGDDGLDPAAAREPVPRLRGKLAHDVRGVRVGIPEDLFATSCDPDIRASFEAAVAELMRLGVQPRRVPSITMRQALAIAYPLLLAEAASYHADDLRDRLDLYSRDLRVFFPTGLLVDGPYYLRCQRVREQVRVAQLEQLREVDAFVLPTVGFLPDLIPDVPGGLTFLSGEEFGLYTIPFDLSGVPAISVPCGFTPAGLPVGLQIAGRPFDELTVLRLARSYEQATGWSSRRPPLEALAR